MSRSFVDDTIYEYATAHSTPLDAVQQALSCAAAKAYADIARVRAIAA